MSTPSVGGVHCSMSAIYAHQLVSYLEKRKAEAERIRQKYPDRIPVRISSVPLLATRLMMNGMPLRFMESAGHLREG